MKLKATISAGGGEETVTPDTVTANGWTSLGIFHFNATGDEYLKLTVAIAGAHSRVADVKFVKTEDPGYETVIWDDSGSMFSSSGTWTEESGLGYDGGSAHKTTETGALATWSAYPPKTGTFQIYYWNPAVQEGETRSAPAVRYRQPGRQLAQHAPGPGG